MLLRNMSILFLIFPLFCFAQTAKENDSSANEFKNEIQFYFVDQLSAAYKYNLSETSALRLRINIKGSFNNENSDYIRGIGNNYYKTHNAVSNHFFEINIHYLYQINLHQIANLYFGGGPFVNYVYGFRRNWSDEYNNENILRDRFYDEVKEDTWDLGISVLVGFEFIVYKNIRLFTEYEASLSKGWYNRKNYSPPPNYYSSNYKEDLWGYELKGIRVGAGVYF